jgi:polysaccharide export outer membrane protein
MDSCLRHMPGTRHMFVVMALALAVAAPVAARSAAAQVLDYQLGPGDVLSIHVTGVREFQQTSRVSNSGRIRVPYVGIMFVSGQTALQLEREIARKIKEHQLVNEPTVRIQVEQHRAQPAYAIGEVNNPGQFVITSELYLLDLISKAGGLLPAAADEGFLYRRNSPQPEIQTRLILSSSPVATTGEAPVTTLPTLPRPADDSDEVMKIDFKALREGTKPELNVRLEGGDILYVPRRIPDSIYIIGDVRVPGAYTLPRRGEVTAAQAVIYAGGPLATAKMGNSFLMRHDENGERQAIPVNFADIIAGKQPDIPVKANDIIFIPNSAVKSIGVGLLNLVPRLIQQFLIF